MCKHMSSRQVDVCSAVVCNRALSMTAYMHLVLGQEQAPLIKSRRTLTSWTGEGQA